MDPLDLISQGKIKRYFRATRKLNAPNLVSHVTQRAAGKEQKTVSCPSGFILNLLPEGNVARKERYRRLLQQGSELEMGQVLEQEDTIERFLSKLATIFPSLFRGGAKKRQIAGPSGIDLLDTAELEKQIETVRTGHFSNKPESLKAKKYLIEQLIARGYTWGHWRLGLES